MDPEGREIMTVAEVAEYLQLAERTVLRMAQRGEIPAAKIASQWRFMRSVVRDWLAVQMHGVGSRPGRSSGPLLPLSQLVRPELASPRVRPGTKAAVMQHLVTPLRDSGFAADPERLLVALMERERMMSTAVGHGVAIPHPRQPLPGMFPEPAVALGICREGTDFDAVDDRPVRVFFLVCSTGEEIHLHIMARIGWLARHSALMTELEGLGSPEDVAAFCRRADTALGSRPDIHRAN